MKPSYGDFWLHKVAEELVKAMSLRPGVQRAAQCIPLIQQPRDYDPDESCVQWADLESIHKETYGVSPTPHRRTQYMHFQTENKVQ